MQVFIRNKLCEHVKSYSCKLISICGEINRIFLITQSCCGSCNYRWSAPRHKGNERWYESRDRASGLDIKTVHDENWVTDLKFLIARFIFRPENDEARDKRSFEMSCEDVIAGN